MIDIERPSSPSPVRVIGNAGAVVVQPAGPLDNETAAFVKELVEAAWTAATDVVVDLHRVTTATESAMEMLDGIRFRDMSRVDRPRAASSAFREERPDE